MLLEHGHEHRLQDGALREVAAAHRVPEVAEHAGEKEGGKHGEVLIGKSTTLAEPLDEALQARIEVLRSHEIEERRRRVEQAPALAGVVEVDQAQAITAHHDVLGQEVAVREAPAVGRLAECLEVVRQAIGEIVQQSTLPLRDPLDRAKVTEVRIHAEDALRVPAWALEASGPLPRLRRVVDRRRLPPHLRVESRRGGGGHVGCLAGRAQWAPVDPFEEVALPRLLHARMLGGNEAGTVASAYHLRRANALPVQVLHEVELALHLRIATVARLVNAQRETPAAPGVDGERHVLPIGDRPDVRARE